MSEDRPDRRRPGVRRSRRRTWLRSDSFRYNIAGHPHVKPTLSADLPCRILNCLIERGSWRCAFSTFKSAVSIATSTVLSPMTNTAACPVSITSRGDDR